MYLALIIFAICFGPWFLFGVNWWSPIAVLAIGFIPFFLEAWWDSYSYQFDTEWEATEAFYKDLFTLHWRRFWDFKITDDRSERAKKRTRKSKGRREH